MSAQAKKVVPTVVIAAALFGGYFVGRAGESRLGAQDVSPTRAMEREVEGEGKVDMHMAQYALGRLEVDEAGFDRMDRELLLTLIEKYDGGPVGIETLAAAISEDRGTIEDIYEPFLIQEGFLDRTPRGRVATARAYEHFGISPLDGQRPTPRGQQEKLL